jgi:hypothetical protein
MGKDDQCIHGQASVSLMAGAECRADRYNCSSTHLLVTIKAWAQAKNLVTFTTHPVRRGMRSTSLQVNG